MKALDEVRALRPAMRRSGNRITWPATLLMLIDYAYQTQSWRVSGLEPSASFYLIEATTAESATDEQIRLMFRTLLAERFRLAVHQQSVQRDVYSLVIGRNGPKIKPAANDGKPTPLPEWFRGKDEVFARSIEGRILRTAEGRGINAITGRRVTMSQLTEVLEDVLHTPVTDKTGLSGDYYFGMLFARDDAGPSPEGGAVDAPSVFAALQEELGLKLEKQKGPVEVLVVDRVQKTPTSN